MSRRLPALEYLEQGSGIVNLNRALRGERKKAHGFRQFQGRLPKLMPPASRRLNILMVKLPENNDSPLVVTTHLASCSEENVSAILSVTAATPFGC